MPWKWYDSHIMRIEDAGPNIKCFWLEVHDVENFDFLPGQFVTMDLPIHEKRLKRWRSYSIANGPLGGNVLEFCIVKLDKGAASTYLFEEARVGTAVRFKGPDGGFVLPDPIDHDMIMVCTGTGVAPFRSMLQAIQHGNIPHKNLHLIFGTRNEEGILYRKEFEQLALEWPAFEYSLALSREPEWAGTKGHVHQIYEGAYSEVKPDRHFYLCGWSQMIDEAVAKIMLGMGYDKSQIHYELYG
ncbi:MAG: FAD-dependent oxidoreductase [Saprospiraceae bacterium]|nr:FAD-dependent oxidoreductase [Saprospiraceae bacterium]